MQLFHQSTRTLRDLALWVFIVFLGSSCTNTRPISYFNELKDATLQADFKLKEPAIQINDILSINVSSLDKDASAVFNAPNESSYNTNNLSTVTNRLTIGYLVDNNGEIQFPIIGKIRIAGMTKYELTDKLTKELKERKLLVEPVVTIRHLNYRVSVLGEVGHPGVFSVPNEKLNILEALSFAGDITIYGRRDNVLLMRENDKGEKFIKRIDLTSNEILSSPLYYLQSNDILYVEPKVNRLSREKAYQTLPTILSALSLIIIGITNLK
jgi:polysaccharide export outer membrane protein